VTIKAVVSDAYGTLYDIQSEAMALACVKNHYVARLTLFKAIRTQIHELGLEPDYRIHALAELPGLVASHEP